MIARTRSRSRAKAARILRKSRHDRPLDRVQLWSMFRSRAA
jgi:hypothetical protein